jgi:hypothetical protein
MKKINATDKKSELTSVLNSYLKKINLARVKVISCFVMQRANRDF